ncbi:MAG TPA: hypothetical protein VNA20_17625 [Frankiaceae bacterium]|nr:hypothetical protein [Frankiaceae bacterium]
MPSRATFARALGAVTVAAATLTAATVGSTATPVRADAGGPVAEPHGDPVEAAEAWRVAGTSLTAAAPAWCGEVRQSDDVVNEVAQSGPRWHVVVAVPTDIAANVLYATGGGQQRMLDHAFQSVKTIEQFYRVRVGTGDIGQPASDWTLRWDYGTSCGPQYPDVSIYHLPRSQAQYTAEPFSGIVADLDASNLYERADSRYLVHYAGRSIYCGQSYIYSPTDARGGARYSITYNLHTIAALAPNTAGCDWTTDAHEIGHSMGAATGGPLNNDGAHTWDCNNDVMSYGGRVCGDGALYYDFGEDNYFGHSGAWYDTDQSAFWCKPGC